MKLKDEADQPIYFELHPDRLLLDPKFEGYKLSLETLPSYVVPLPTEVDHAASTDDQYTLQYVKLAALNNHIFPDPWVSGTVYIVDTTWALYKSSTSGQRFGELSKAWTIPESRLRKPGRFNVTMIFPDENHALLADGCGGIYILDTGPRSLETGSEWKILLYRELFTSKKNSQFIALDSIQYQEGETMFFDVLLLRIDEEIEWKEFLESCQASNLSRHPFVNVLEWLTFSNDGNQSLRIESSRTLVGRGGIDYAVIEANGTALYVSTDDTFVFCYDSKNPVTAPIPSEQIPNERHSDGETTETDYVWYQNETDIILWFSLPLQVKKSDLITDISVNDIHVEYKNEVILSGKFFASIKSDEGTCTLEPGKLEITLPKDEIGIWSELIPGNKNGEQVEDPKLVDRIQLAYMCSNKWSAESNEFKANVFNPEGQDFEECDEFPDNTMSLIRIDRRLQRITNEASLDCRQWLFNVITDPRSVRSICFRDDVDAIVWQPQLPVQKMEEAGNAGTLEWSCKHIATFSALGYVQAGRQSKKFTLSSPDFSYAVICDSVKHVYVFRQPSRIENDLRNRRTGIQVSHIAREQIISLDPPQEVMGACAGNEFLFVLTPKNLHLIRMKEPETI